jgi:uncharacterized protein with FMN-binding domain
MAAREGIMKQTFVGLLFVAAALPAAAQIDVNTGNVTVRVLYQGQPLQHPCRLYFSSQTHGFGCGTSYQNVATGNFTLTESHGYPIPPVNFTITAGQTTTVDVEISGQIGIVTGRVFSNGQPAVNYHVYPGTETGDGYTDATGRFSMYVLAGAGTATVYGSNVQLAMFPFTGVAGQTVDVGTIATSTGNVTVRVLYQGQPLQHPCRLYFSSQTHGFGCGTSYQNVATGNFTLTESHGYPIPPVNFTITAGQTTTVNVEISGQIGIITGRVFSNGQPAVNYHVYPGTETGDGYTDATGRFYMYVLAGPRTGYVFGSGVQLATFGYLGVAGQTRDIGTVGSTTLNGTLAGKTGSLASRTWTFRIDNTGVNAAANTQLDSMTLTQTTWPPNPPHVPTCSPTPTITSTFPRSAGYLAPGASGTVSVNINFSGCQANARFTAVINYSANGGTATGSKTITLQNP